MNDELKKLLEGVDMTPTDDQRLNGIVRHMMFDIAWHVVGAAYVLTRGKVPEDADAMRATMIREMELITAAMRDEGSCAYKHCLDGISTTVGAMLEARLRGIELMPCFSLVERPKGDAA